MEGESKMSSKIIKTAKKIMEIVMEAGLGKHTCAPACDCAHMYTRSLARRCTIEVVGK